jgi:hypothetical protein
LGSAFSGLFVTNGATISRDKSEHISLNLTQGRVGGVLQGCFGE